MPIPRPNYPSMEMDNMMGAGELGQLQANSDAEETAIAYVEASIAMLKNAAESFPPLQPGIKQMSQFMGYVLRQAIEGQGQAGPQAPPEEQPQGEPAAGPAMPPPM